MENQSNYIRSLIDEIQIAAGNAGFTGIGYTSIDTSAVSNFQNMKSAFVFALPYPAYRVDLPVDPGSGRIAAFASGFNYHELVKEKLSYIISNISTDISGISTIHVDDKHIKERYLALKAGIGWIGKNQCLYLPDHGSYVVIGEILTEIQIPVEPVQQHSRCGSCEKCIKCCPTGALISGGGFIKEKCISYLTQSKGLIPEDMVKLMDDWVYGCDVCQAVCPYNSGCLEIDSKLTLNSIPLIKLLSAKKDDLKSIDPSNAISWIGKNNLRRNAIIAAVNKNCAKYMDVIKELVNDPSYVVSETAKNTLARMF